jgi:hypothetical protein
MIPLDKMLRGTYVSRAIEVPRFDVGSYTGMYTYLLLFGAWASESQYTQDIDPGEFYAEIRVATVATPSEWGAWVALPVPAECGMIDLSTYFDRLVNLKVQIRLKGLISGWAIVSQIGNYAV